MWIVSHQVICHINCLNRFIRFRLFNFQIQLPTIFSFYVPPPISWRMIAIHESCHQPDVYSLVRFINCTSRCIYMLAILINLFSTMYYISYFCVKLVDIFIFLQSLELIFTLTLFPGEGESGRCKGKTSEFGSPEVQSYITQMGLWRDDWLIRWCMESPYI